MERTWNHWRHTQKKKKRAVGANRRAVAMATRGTRSVSSTFHVAISVSNKSINGCEIAKLGVIGPSAGLIVTIL